MTRRVFLALVAAFGLSPVHAAAPSLPFADPAEIVRALYAREAARQANGKGPSEEEFLAEFSRDLRALFRAGRDGAASGATGRKLNAWFGWGVLPGQPVAVGRVRSLAGGVETRVVAVDLTVRGEARQVYVHLVAEGDRWAVGNIIYDAGDDFRTVREALAGY